jgi:hypothetical protein
MGFPIHSRSPFLRRFTLTHACALSLLLSLFVACGSNPTSPQACVYVAFPNLAFPLITVHDNITGKPICDALIVIQKAQIGSSPSGSPVALTTDADAPLMWSRCCANKCSVTDHRRWVRMSI